MKNKNKNTLVVVFFVVFFLIGCLVVDDYGVSLDEDIRHYNGQLGLKYILEDDQRIFGRDGRHYGLAYEVFLAWLQKSLGISENAKEVFLLRHRINFLLFFLSVIVFYFLLKGRLKSSHWSLCGCLFLVLSPRIFAHSFFNSKDILFLAYFIVAIYTLIRYIEKRNFRWILWHGIVTAALINTRMLGLFIFGLTVIFSLFQTDSIRRREVRGTERIGHIIFFFVVVFSLLYISMPVLWQNPRMEFLKAVNLMDISPWKHSVLFLGDYVKASNLPWYYIPVWVGLTTPLLYLVFACAGMVCLVHRVFASTVQWSKNNVFDSLILIWFAGPLLYICLSKPIIYDGWRHLYFIYPAVVVMAVIGLKGITEKISKSKKTKAANFALGTLFVCVIVNLTGICYAMIKDHPLQNVYFNRLAHHLYRPLHRNFEMDYWGLSYKKALEEFLDMVDDRKVRVQLHNRHYFANIALLQEDQKNRIALCARGERYFITNFRFLSPDHYVEPRLLQYGREINTVYVGGARVNGAYKIKPETPVNDPQCVDRKTVMVDYVLNGNLENIEVFRHLELP